MEGRKIQPSRKARDEARNRIEAEMVKKATKKSSPTANVKRARKSKSEERPAGSSSTDGSKAKKSAKAPQNPLPSLDSPKNSKKSAKTKEVNGNDEAKPKHGKRSQSAGPEVNASDTVVDTKPQKSPEEAKKSKPVKGKGAKKVAEAHSIANNSDQHENNEMAKSKEAGEDPKSRGKKVVENVESSKGRGGKKKAEEEEKEEAPPVKKGRQAKKPEEESEKAPEPMKKGRGNKPAKEDSQDDGEEVPAKGRGKVAKQPSKEADEAAPPKKSRGKKAAEENGKDEDEAPAKKGKTKKQASTEDEGETSEKPPKALMNNTETDYKSMNFGIKESFNLKIATWNVAGLRALVKKNPDYFEHEQADIICMNEIKCGTEKEVPDEVKLEGYHAYWNLAKGDPGVGILSKVKPINVSYDLPKSQFSDEKRLITAEYEKFYLVSVYVVNSGRQLVTLDKRMEWNKVFDAHIQDLDAKKPVIIAGDLNVSHQEIDLANPKGNMRSAGFTKEERDGFTKLLSYGFVDTFRHFNPDKTGAYTYWTYMGGARGRNVGWRLDYFVVSKRFMKHVKDNVIRSSVMGSDHCPIVLFLQL